MKPFVYVLLIVLCLPTIAEAGLLGRLFRRRPAVRVVTPRVHVEVERTRPRVEVRVQAGCEGGACGVGVGRWRS